VLVADASASVREAVQRVLEEDEFCVDIQSSDVASLLIRGRLQPQAIVIDHLLPGGALTAIRRLRAARGGSAPIVLIGPREHDETSLAAVRAGCSAVVPRTADKDVLVGAIRDVLRGGVSLDPQLASLVVRDYQSTARLTVSGGESFPFRLSSQEMRVLELLATGMTTAEIARKLFVTTATVRSHVARIVRSIGVQDRTAAVKRFSSWQDRVGAPDQLDLSAPRTTVVG
jgi:DNA-binding NarL/FixJ family response regulator